LPVRRGAPCPHGRAHAQALSPRRPHEGEAGTGGPRLKENGPGSGMKEPRVVFGFHAVLARLRADPASVVEIFLDEARNDSRVKDLLAIAEGSKVRLMRVTKERLDGFGDRHQGVVAKVHLKNLAAEPDEVLEGNEKPFL